MKFNRIAAVLAAFLMISFAYATVSLPAREIVKPGGEGTNTDTSVVNDESSQGNITVSPKGNHSDVTATTVTTQSGVSGKISGVEIGDRVNLGSGNTNVVVNTCGGTVTLSGGSTNITISNAEKNPDGTPNTNNTIIVFPSGDFGAIPPGDSYYHNPTP